MDKTSKYAYDFSNVDFITGKGEWFEVDIVSGERISDTDDSFDPIEKINALIHGLDEAKEKFRAAHPGIYLAGDDDEEILKFSNICNDFDMRMLKINSHIFDIDLKFICPAISGDLQKDLQQMKEDISKIYTELSSIKEKLNNSLIKLSELTESSRRDNKRCSCNVNFAISSLNNRYQNGIKFYKYKENLKGGSNISSKEINEINEIHEIHELLRSCIMEFPEIARTINKCTKSLENLLDEHFPVLPDNFFL